MCLEFNWRPLSEGGSVFLKFSLGFATGTFHSWITFRRRRRAAPTNDLLMPDGFNLFCKLFPISKAMKIHFPSPLAQKILFVHKQIVFVGHHEMKIHN